MKGYHTHQSCIDACLKCAAICDHCALACTLEKDINMMVRCIQLDMECAVVCYAAARLMSFGSEKAMDICEICADICDACSEECGMHDNGHCRECSKACAHCAEECRSAFKAA